MLISMLEEGSFYCEGSFQRLVDALAMAVERHGGEVALGQRVERILVVDGAVTGVVLAGGREITATAVVSNADARQTFEDLIGADRVPAPFARRMRRLEPSLSACVLYAATDLDLRRHHLAHETFLYKHWDHEATYQDILQGQPGGMWFNVPTLIDPSLAPAGEHLVILTALAPYDIGTPWAEAKERYTDLLLDELEGVFPGFREHLTFAEVATPPTFERYALNQRGAIYGWANTPEQATTGRPAHETPIKGLYLSGHWSQPGTGSLRAIYSGMQTAQVALGYPHFGAFLAAVGDGAMPRV
jgi:prolycopene isomerase